jgi:hypothetical protein
MSSTEAEGTNQGRFQSVIFADSNPAQRSLALHPHKCDPALITVSVFSITPRITSIHWNSPAPGSQRDP